MQPKFLSLEFHTRFFPALLWRRFRPREREGPGFSSGFGSGFSSTLEHYILLAICLILALIGIPNAVSHRSIIGWIMAGVGIAGIVALFIHSIASRGDGPASYSSFLAEVFFFFVTLGITAGVFIGAHQHSYPLGFLIGSGGSIAGYLLGLLAGLWLQYLGWLSGIVNGLAGLAVLGMLVVDLMLLSGSLF